MTRERPGVPRISVRILESIKIILNSDLGAQLNAQECPTEVLEIEKKTLKSDLGLMFAHESPGEVLEIDKNNIKIGLWVP